MFARKDELYWKQHIDFHSKTLEINYNYFTGNTEEKLSQMSYLIDHTFKQGIAWRIVLPSTASSVGQGMKHYKKSLEVISDF